MGSPFERSPGPFSLSTPPTPALSRYRPCPICVSSRSLRHSLPQLESVDFLPSVSSVFFRYSRYSALLVSVAELSSRVFLYQPPFPWRTSFLDSRVSPNKLNSFPLVPLARVPHTSDSRSSFFVRSLPCPSSLCGRRALFLWAVRPLLSDIIFRPLPTLCSTVVALSVSLLLPPGTLSSGGVPRLL